LDTLALFAVAALVMAAATAVQVAAGLGFALVAVPPLVALDPMLVPGPMFTAGVVLILWQFVHERRHLPWHLAPPTLGGLVVGTALGIVATLFLPEGDPRPVFGAIILLAVAISVAAPRLPPNPTVLALAGLGSGMMGAIAGVHGPLVALALLHLPLPAYRAFLGLFFTVAFVLVMPGLWAAGRYGGAEFLAGLALLPGVLAGVWLAGPLRRAIPTGALRTFVLGLSGVSGLALILA
jgi:uncharacterized membrane protein YfcA